MTLNELLVICDQISPFELQESWDNSGLMIGDPNEEIEKIYLALEADSFVIDRIPESSCLIAHHPLIFSPLRSLNFAEYPANILKKAIKKNISIVAMHTNFDQTRLNPFVAEKILGWKNFAQNGFVCTAETQIDFETLKAQTKAAFGKVRSFVEPKKKLIKKVAFCCGSGGSLIGEIDADALITGDLKYHDAIKASELGIGAIDAGHYETERFFGDAMREALAEKGIDAIIAASKNPFGDGI